MNMEVISTILSLNLITFVYSFKDKTANEVRGRFLFVTLFVAIIYFLINYL